MSQTDATAERLKSYIDRIERLDDDKKGIADDIRDLYIEAKFAGFDPKIMRQVIKLRKMAATEREEQEELIDVYMRNLGMIADTHSHKAA